MKPVQFVALGIAFAASSIASAQTTTYTTQAAFAAAVSPGAYTETFSTLLPSANTFSFSGSGFSYTAAAPSGANMYSNGDFIGNFTANQTLTITFSSNVTAVGGEFYLTDSGDNFVAGPVTLTLADATTRTYTPSGPNASAFTGFTSSIPIVSLVMAAPAPGAFNFNTLDNLTVGIATAVPEPMSALLLSLGLGGLLLARRRQASI